jgi:hypothetical protein
MLQREVVDHMPGFEDVDLCTNPEAMCQYDELKWMGALYYWTTVVQENTLTGLGNVFEASLWQYAANGFDQACSEVGGASFPEGCGSSVNNGVWATGPHGAEGRQRYFDLIMDAMKAGGLLATAEKPNEGGCRLSNSTGGSDSTSSAGSALDVAACNECSGEFLAGGPCYVSSWAEPCMDSTRAYCLEESPGVWCPDITGESASECGACVSGGLGSCYVASWEEPCMDSTEAVCQEEGGVWCGEVVEEEASAEGHNDSQSEPSPARVTLKIDNFNGDAYAEFSNDRKSDITAALQTDISQLIGVSPESIDIISIAGELVSPSRRLLEEDQGAQVVFDVRLASSEQVQVPRRTLWRGLRGGVYIQRMHAYLVMYRRWPLKSLTRWSPGIWCLNRSTARRTLR